MDFAMSLTRRATCKRAQFSCVITSEDMTQIYGFGYNGTAKGFSHDDCKADLPGGCGCVHAEQNALIKVRVNEDRKSTRLNSSHRCNSYAVFCLKKKKTE